MDTQGIRPGDIVCSRCGRDAGRRMLVLAVRAEPDGQWYLELCDGRIRRVEKPKRKKLKHVEVLSGAADLPEDNSGGTKPAECLRKTAEKAQNGEKITNSEVRRTLNAYAEVHSADGFDGRRDADVKG